MEHTASIAKFLIVLGVHYCIIHLENYYVQSSMPNDVIGPEMADLEWWQKTIIYQIYPRSFQDTNGDGVGDLKGITSRLDYLQYLNVETVWLSPIYESPMVDHGYDISNHTAIDPLFGNMDDFDELIEAIHDRGMKLVMDYIPNHTSDKHPWFLASRKGGDCNPYADFYVWHEGNRLENGTIVPPNNWESIFAQSAWTWDSERQAYYLHQFAIEQPDLDYRNPNVVVEMMTILQFWLDKGVDGFRIDAIQTMFEVQDFRDEPRSFKPGVKQYETQYLRHIYTQNQPEIHDVTRAWRNLFDKHEEATGKHVFMVSEVYDETLVQTMKYYNSGSDMPFNFMLITIDNTCGGTCFFKHIKYWMEKMPDGKWPNFVTGNHDNTRVTTRKGPQYVDALNILVLTLPGTPTTYQGEELGLMDISVSYQDTQDPWGRNIGEELYKKYTRDPCRAPMQWDDGPNAGFSSANKTWLPVHPDFVTRNAKEQRNDPSGRSHLQIYKKVSKLRHQPSFQNSNIEYAIVNENIFSYVRRSDGHPSYFIALNLGSSASTDDYGEELRKIGFPGTGSVILTTGNMTEHTWEEKEVVDFNHITLSPGDGIIALLNEEQLKDEL